LSIKVRYPSQHEQFNFQRWEQVEAKLKQLGLSLPYSENIAVLLQPLQAGSLAIPNALAIHPIEGCDGSDDGAPQELTFRRYRRFAGGGAGLLWMEATSVVREARANPRQLWLHDATAPDFAHLHESIIESAAEQFGADHRPVTVVQLTHSGRYSKPHGVPEPIIAHHSPVLDPRSGLGPDDPLITDDELDALQDYYVQAARLAYEAGFDAVDIKACHAYLLNELLASHTREDSKYGGSFDNRIRMLTDVVKRVGAEVPEIALMCRLNVYDAQPYPYGFGMTTDGSMEPDLSEPIELIKRLYQAGVCLVNVAYGSPYYNPHVERPYDTSEVGGYVPGEHPLVNLATMVQLQRELAQALPEAPMVATGFTWLRQFGPHVAAAMVEDDLCALVGFGRMALAYPEFARDLMENGELIPTKTCIACSSCTQIMRDGGRAGCVVRDHEIYAPIFYEGQMRNPAVMRELAAVCRECAAPTCQLGCPAGVDIPGFVRAIADGDEKRAYEVLCESNPLPEICAYVCPAEVQCEGHCVQQWIGRGAVPIRLLQRYVSECARNEGYSSLALPEKVHDKSVAVIGAGVAGLACAIRLLQKGYTVTIIDAREEVGGVAAETISTHRLDQGTAIAEISSILGDVPQERLQWRLGTTMGQKLTVDDLFAEGFEAVFIGIGLGEGISLPGATPPQSGVVEALSFLRDIKSDPDTAVPAAVAVLGGGNTAMDAAVAAKRAGATDVYLIYRRSFAEMPAWPRERDEALAEGVHFLILTQPLDYVTDENGKLVGIKVVSTILGEPDGSGRRRPVPVAGSERAVAADLSIEAMGQSASDDIAGWAAGVTLTEAGLIKVADDNLQTSRAGVFAGGDIINGGTTVVQAVAEGVKAADGIVQFLSELPFRSL